MQEWSCEDYIDFEKLKKRREIINYVTSGAQVTVYTWLLFVLIIQRRKKNMISSKLSILIAVFALLSAVCGLVQANSINAIFDIVDPDDLGHKAFIGINHVFALGAIWFYSIRYFETAADLKQIVIKRRAISKSRKRNYLILKCAVFALICICQSMEFFAFSQDALSQTVDTIVYSIGWDITMLMTIIFNFLVAFALFRVTKIVNRTK